MTEPEEHSLEDDEFEITPETLEDDERAHADPRGTPLPFGGDLNAVQLRALQLARPVRTIALFGEHRSGKTTLVSEIYHALCGGPFADHIFAESRTIAGFERRLHPARLKSGRSTEDTARTSSNKELTYLHLRLLAEGSRTIDLAWTDRAGEDYRAVDAATEASDLPLELGASQQIALLIDGAKLAEASERANVIQRARLSLRKLVDLHVVGKTHHVSFVTTKADLFQAAEVKPRVDAALLGLRERCEKVRLEVGSISFFETSVRQERRMEIDLPRPYGLDQLLKHWTAPAVDAQGQVFQPKLERQLDRLLVRRYEGVTANDE